MAEEHGAALEDAVAVSCGWSALERLVAVTVQLTDTVSPIPWPMVCARAEAPAKRGRTTVALHPPHREPAHHAAHARRRHRGAAGLREGPSPRYGVAAVSAGVPLPTVAAVLGHARLTTTALYTTAIGAEAREASESWEASSWSMSDQFPVPALHARSLRFASRLVFSSRLFHTELCPLDSSVSRCHAISSMRSTSSSFSRNGWVVEP